MTQTDILQSAPASHKDYDEVPYPGNAFAQSHPSHLAAVARICGLQPAPPDNCRVLELGCSIGSNLIPMAESLPGSDFVGIDLSTRQIDEGHATLAQLNLENVQMRHMDIRDVDESLGKFDYIVSHGVYSWVPHDVQNAMLEVGRRHLNENGIMYVSYNTYPGWHLREPVRDMMRYHAANFQTPKDKIRQARELIKFVAESAKTRFEAYPKMLHQEVESLKERSDYYLYHEYLESVNEPVYFYEFVERLQAAGLQYIADGEIRTMMAHFFDDNVAELLRNVPMLRREQYMDFLRSRMFRASLVTHTAAKPQYQVTSNCLIPLHVGLISGVKLDSESAGNTTWLHPNGKITTSSPMTEVVKLLNSRWPGWVPVQEVVDGPLNSPQQGKYLNELMTAMIQGIICFADSPPSVCREVNHKPMCTPFARLQARDRDTVTNRKHGDVHVERLTRLVAEQADGTHTVEDLANVLDRRSTDGSFMVMSENRKVDAPGMVDWRPVVQQELSRLAMSSLLVG